MILKVLNQISSKTKRIILLPRQVSLAMIGVKKWETFRPNSLASGKYETQIFFFNTAFKANLEFYIFSTRCKSKEIIGLFLM